MIVGHTRPIRYLEAVLQNGTLAHAYIFHGPEGVGKKTVALALAKSIFCKEKPERLGGCSPSPVLPGKTGEGTCEDCRLTDELRHPDLALLAADTPLIAEEGRGIGIKNIRELIRRLALSAWRGGRKVVLIDGADALSRDAQAALLKLVEEPDGKTVFFFITASPDLLLPTIRSRGVAINFTEVGESELSPFVGTLPSMRQRSLLALARGRPGVLMRLVADKEFFEELRDREGAYPKILETNLADQFDFSLRASRESDALESFLGYLIRRKRSELHDALGAPGPERPFAAGAFLASILGRLSLVRSTNVNRRLILDGIFIELALSSPAGQPVRGAGSVSL